MTVAPPWEEQIFRLGPFGKDQLCLDVMISYVFTTELRVLLGCVEFCVFHKQEEKQTLWKLTKTQAYIPFFFLFLLTQYNTVIQEFLHQIVFFLAISCLDFWPSGFSKNKFWNLIFISLTVYLVLALLFSFGLSSLAVSVITGKW